MSNYLKIVIIRCSWRCRPPVGAKDCTPEINTSEIIVDCQWHFPMDFSVNFQHNFTVRWYVPWCSWRCRPPVGRLSSHQHTRAARARKSANMASANMVSVALIVKIPESRFRTKRVKIVFRTSRDHLLMLKIRADSRSHWLMFSFRGPELFRAFPSPWPTPPQYKYRPSSSSKTSESIRPTGRQTARRLCLLLFMLFDVPYLLYDCSCMLLFAVCCCLLCAVRKTAGRFHLLLADVLPNVNPENELTIKYI